MGGFHGLCAFSALYEAGMGQGDPIFALFFCLVNTIRLAVVIEIVGMNDMPAGPLRQLGVGLTSLSEWKGGRGAS